MRHYQPWFKPGLVCPIDKRWQHLPLPIDDPIMRKGIPHLFYVDLFSEHGRPLAGPVNTGCGPWVHVNLKTLWERKS
jgi:hypothetical protein